MTIVSLSTSCRPLLTNEQQDEFLNLCSKMHTLHMLPCFSANFQLPTKILSVKPQSRSPQLLALQVYEDVLFDPRYSMHILSVCATERNQKLASSIHSRIIKLGQNTDTVVCNSLLNVYSKFGSVQDAYKLFDEMIDRTVVSWTSMISGLCANGKSVEAITIFCEMLEHINPNEFTFSVLLQACTCRVYSKLVQIIHGYILKNGLSTDNFLQNSLIAAYSKCGSLDDAEIVINRSNCRDVVSWTSVISACIADKMSEKAFDLFFQMQEDGVIPNKVTILSLLQACSLMNDLRIFQWIHTLILKGKYRRNPSVMNSLVEMYSVNGFLQQSTKIFCEFCFTGEGQYLSPETMASIIKGCAQSGYFSLGEEIHGYLMKHGFFPSTVTENSLINMYADNEFNDSAYKLFNLMSKRDIVSWNTMINCLVKHSRSSEALVILSELHSHGEESPDFVTVLASLQACSNLVSLQLGQVIHGYMIRTGLICDVFVQNSLLDMYGKSGELDYAEKIFEEIGEKDLVSFNSMISAYGVNGKGKSALKIFSKHKNWKIKPNTITFVNVLSSCVHSGLLEEGLEAFNSMKRDYMLEPRKEHYACMVGLLGRLGKLEEAQDFIETMSASPGPDMWGALLGACGIFGNLEIAERAAEKLSDLEPEGRAWKVALANVYASTGRWQDAVKVRGEVEKEGGWSSVEVRGNMFRFMVGDTKHPDSEKIYEVLNIIKGHIKAVDISF